MSKVITFSEFRSHSTKDNLWLLLHQKVYDVSKFIDEHPGGDEVMLAEAGRDATEAFEDVGHSDEARALLPDLLVGSIEETQPPTKSSVTSSRSFGVSPTTTTTAEPSNMVYLAPIGFLFAYFAWRYYASVYAPVA